MVRKTYGFAQDVCPTMGSMDPRFERRRELQMRQLATAQSSRRSREDNRNVGIRAADRAQIPPMRTEARSLVHEVLPILERKGSYAAAAFRGRPARAPGWRLGR